MLAVDENDLGDRRVVGVEKAGIDADAVGVAVPLAVGLEGAAVSERGTTARGAEVVRHLFGVPPIDRVVGRACGRMKVLRLEVGQERSPFGALRAGAAHELLGHVAIDSK